MNSQLPTQHQIDKLLAYLPILYAPGFKPVKEWSGGKRNAEGIIPMPYPEYEDVVMEFFELLSRDGWIDYGYDPEKSYHMLKNDALIASAGIPEIKTMLTFCLRGERFSDGHWESMIVDGYIRRLLERLAQISSGMNREGSSLE